MKPKLECAFAKRRPVHTSAQRVTGLIAGRILPGSRETDGLAMRSLGSLGVTGEDCINKAFSSQAQSGAHTNSLCCKGQCVRLRGPGTPCQTGSLSEKVNTVKLSLCTEMRVGI